MKKFFFSCLLLLLFGFSFAHQPRLVFKQAAGEIIQVQNPEISQAFYGMLSGQEDVYQIVTDTGFFLYVNIVVPDQEGQRKDFFVDIQEGNSAVYTRLDGKKFERIPFFEPFGGDAYLMGPTLEKDVGPGTYTLSVSNSDNQGKYALAIGKIERFTLKETIATYKTMPVLKMQFFEKPRYMIYWSIIGAFLGGMIIVLIAIIRGVVKLVKYSKRR